MLSSRRQFLRTASTIPFGAVSFSLLAQDNPERFPGLIVRSSAPVNLEFPFSSLNERMTPNEQFFVRCHFPIPEIKVDDWRLTVDGTVREKLSLTYNDLLKLPSVTENVTLECAGNGRVFLKPVVGGLQWGHGAVSTANWKGVSLATLLEKSGIQDSAVEVMIEGTDQGQIITDPKSPGPITFNRSIPLSKAQQKETILAYEMNGKPLPSEHGFPVRAIIPGWFGMSCVKWVKRITAVNKPHQGFWQSLDYSYWERHNGVPSIVPLTQMQVKTVIAKPSLNEVVIAGKVSRIFGAAWTGESKIKKVEVTTDGGKNWSEAKLLDQPEKYVWCFWEYNWKVPQKKGVAKLLARATDEQGNTQPVDRDPDRRTYMINHLIPVDVVIR